MSNNLNMHFVDNIEICNSCIALTGVGKVTGDGMGMMK